METFITLSKTGQAVHWGAPSMPPQGPTALEQSGLVVTGE